MIFLLINSNSAINTIFKKTSPHRNGPLPPTCVFSDKASVLGTVKLNAGQVYFRFYQYLFTSFFSEKAS